MTLRLLGLALPATAPPSRLSLSCPMSLLCPSPARRRESCPGDQRRNACSPLCLLTGRDRPGFAVLSLPRHPCPPETGTDLCQPLTPTPETAWPMTLLTLCSFCCLTPGLDSPKFVPFRPPISPESSYLGTGWVRPHMVHVITAQPVRPWRTARRLVCFRTQP